MLNIIRNLNECFLGSFKNALIGGLFSKSLHAQCISQSDRVVYRVSILSMYHWLARRIEYHVKICVLALMIEHIAERACNKPWHQIPRALDCLHVTKFFNFIYKVRKKIIKADHHHLR